MTPGERAKNWMQALMTVWPIILFLIGGTVYGNSEKVRQFIHGEPLPEIIGEIDQPISQDIHPEVRQKLESIINKLAEQDKSLKQLNNLSQQDDSKLSERVKVIEALVN